MKFLEIKYSFFACLILFLTGCKSAPKNSTETEKPNIVMFLVDDMGWQDTSVPFWNQVTEFNERYHTPNMERLASEGMKFTQAYATPVCSPTRVSFITGMNAARHQVTNWTLKKDALQPMEVNHKTLSFPRWNVNGVSPVAGDPLAVHATPLPQLLQNSGYYTIHAGKAHFGAIGTPGADPLNLGFDVNIAGHAAGAPESYYGKDNFGNGREGKEVWAVPGLEKYHGKDIFLSEALTLEALKAVDQSTEEKKPFFLYMSHYAVHAPIMGDQRFLQKYLDADLDEREAKYATLIEGMDKSLGDIMNYLEENNLAKNTIILFMSDNGGLSVHARGGEPNTHNKPLASGKGSMYEGGIREPMIVKWPGITEAGSETDEHIIIEDFFPSILEMATVANYSTVQKVDGISFVPALKGESINSEERPLIWHYPNEWGPNGPGIGAASTIRLGDWKYIYYHEDQSEELFNINIDIGETNNLINEDPEKAEGLAKILSDYLRKVNAQMPANKKTGQIIPFPDVSRQNSDQLSLKGRLGTVSEENIFKTDDYYNWGASIVKGEDGLYHLFYSRWHRKYSFYGWLTKSTIAHAVSKNPAGPWKYKETVVEGRGPGYWDAITAHNPKIKFFDGKYYLYYIATNFGNETYDEKRLVETSNIGYSSPDWKILRENQRTGVAVSTSLNGPWKRMEQPLIEPSGPITTLTVNPAITKGKDGKYYLIVKGDKPGETGFIRNQAMAVSESPTGPFKMLDQPVIDYMDTEDMSLWYDEQVERFYGIFHSTDDLIGLVTSKDGVNWEKAKDFYLMDKTYVLNSGEIIKPDRFERPFVYVENNEPKVLSLAAKSGDESYTVFIPILKQNN